MESTNWQFVDTGIDLFYDVRYSVRDSEYKEILKWLDNHPSHGRYNISDDFTVMIYFELDEDLTLFLLKWGQKIDVKY